LMRAAFSMTSMPSRRSESRYFQER
jgi:hypothetical protein